MKAATQLDPKKAAQVAALVEGIEEKERRELSVLLNDLREYVTEWVKEKHLPEMLVTRPTDHVLGRLAYSPQDSEYQRIREKVVVELVTNRFNTLIANAPKPATPKKPVSKGKAA